MGDISNEKTFDKIKGKFETVFHLAAKISTAVGQIKSKSVLKPTYQEQKKTCINGLLKINQKKLCLHRQWQFTVK